MWTTLRAWKCGSSILSIKLHHRRHTAHAQQPGLLRSIKKSVSERRGLRVSRVRQVRHRPIRSTRRRRKISPILRPDPAADPQRRLFCIKTCLLSAQTSRFLILSGGEIEKLPRSDPSAVAARLAAEFRNEVRAPLLPRARPLLRRTFFSSTEACALDNREPHKCWALTSARITVMKSDQPGCSLGCLGCHTLRMNSMACSALQRPRLTR